MNVYSYLNPDGPDIDFKLIPLWEESWRRQGWNPRLLTIRDAKRNLEYTPSEFPEWYAWSEVAGGWYSSLCVLNFSFRPHTERDRLLYLGGVAWASPGGIKQLAKALPNNLPIKFKHRHDVVGRHQGCPLITFAGIDKFEEIQEAFAACSQEKKKN